MSLRDTRAANEMPDNTSLGAYREGRALLQARRESGGHMRFPDHASYLRYQRGRAQVQLRQQFRAARIPTPAPPPPPPPVDNVYTSPTRTSNVTVTSSQSPFSGGGNSYEFNDPNNSYLEVSGDNSWAFGTGDFTIEWFQYQADTNPFPRIFTIGSYNGGGISIACSIEGGSFYAWTNSNANFGTDATPYKNQWVHFAIVRASGQLSVYKNGTLFAGPSSNSNNITDNTRTLYFGIETPGDGDTAFNGYLTNIRIVKGLAVYTGDFTVPTSALTLIAPANPYGGSNTAEIPDGYTKLLFVP
jgi:hypothetical protein